MQLSPCIKVPLFQIIQPHKNIFEEYILFGPAFVDWEGGQWGWGKLRYSGITNKQNTNPPNKEVYYPTKKPLKNK